MMSPWVIFWLILCIATSGLAGNVYKKLAVASRSAAQSAFMPSVWFTLLSLLFVGMTLLSGKTPSVTTPLLLTAVGAGICLAVTVVVLMESMKTTAMSLSIIIINLNFIIPVVLSMTFLGEMAGWLQLLGMLASVAVILLLNIGGKSSGGGSKLAMLLPFAASVCNGLVNFLIKVNGHTGGDQNLFSAIMYLSAAAAALLLGLILNAIHPLPHGFRGIFRKDALPFILLMALCNGGCFYSTGRISGHMDAATQFTVVTASSILLSLAIGMLFQKEKFTVKVGLSLLFCMVAILCQAVSL